MRLRVSRSEGHIGFAPKLSPENFKAAFTSAEGWGTYRQRVTEQKLTATIDLHFGTLRLKTMTFDSSRQPVSVRVQVNGVPVEATHDYAAGPGNCHTGGRKSHSNWAED